MLDIRHIPKLNDPFGTQFYGNFATDFGMTELTLKHTHIHIHGHVLTRTLIASSCQELFIINRSIPNTKRLDLPTLNEDYEKYRLLFSSFLERLFFPTGYFTAHVESKVVKSKKNYLADSLRDRTELLLKPIN